MVRRLGRYHSMRWHVAGTRHPPRLAQERVMGPLCSTSRAPQCSPDQGPIEATHWRPLLRHVRFCGQGARGIARPCPGCQTPASKMSLCVFQGIVATTYPCHKQRRQDAPSLAGPRTSQRRVPLAGPPRASHPSRQSGCALCGPVHAAPGHGAHGPPCKLRQHILYASGHLS
jgi:hypothetical protein